MKRIMYQICMTIASEPKVCARAALNREKVNQNGKVTMKCAYAMHFMRRKRWEMLMATYLEHEIMSALCRRENHKVVCKTWWDSFERYGSICIAQQQV